jgi:tripartite-type tricarboxylate transporter receptor subunit TctC
MVYSTTLLANAHLYRKLPYDPLKDFRRMDARCAAREHARGASVDARCARSRTSSRSQKRTRVRISYGSAGIGALQHLSTSLFENMAHVKMVHVPFKGGAPAAIAAASGEIQMMLTPISEVLPHIQSNRSACDRSIVGYARQTISERTHDR